MSWSGTPKRVLLTRVMVKVARSASRSVLCMTVTTLVQGITPSALSTSLMACTRTRQLDSVYSTKTRRSLMAVLQTRVFGAAISCKGVEEALA